ncbi:class I adenylate-forming enzyme family protein [Mycobacterium sp. M26]|uniref:class I adenylate-forming enzyme family protein n=1 Tax=Mycobacterium sp. M26 TaxID=1762962 RepID=UPI00073EB5A3|nr:class I adenylate-forming enzyme family protein [Mycobacterium sp. M26]
MSETIDSLIRERAGLGRQPFLIDSTSQISYAELDTATRDVAAGLISAGVTKGSRIGLIMSNGVRWAQIALAINRIGAVLVPLSTLLAGPELAAQLRVASVRYLISVEEFRGHRYLDEIAGHIDSLPALQTIWPADALPSGAADVDVATAAATVVPADPLVVMFTSGSSGPPKGVIHSHGNAIAAVRAGLSVRRIDHDTRLYVPMPFFWVGGFGTGLLSVLVAGATLVTEAIATPQSTLELMARERVTSFRGWPAQAEALARHAVELGADLSALQPGSLEALLPPERRPPPGARANLLGMTESFGPYCGYQMDTDMPRSAWGSCGKPLPGVEIRIVDTETGDLLPTGSVGTIQIRGRQILRGICRRSREEVFTPDGFFSTGDLGRLDADGFLFYHGRSDNMFKVSGATVYPSEVEAGLRAIDGVRAAYVTDVEGRVGAALVSGLSIEDLRAAARTQLSAFKVPTIWVRLASDDEVPRGSTGKLDVRRLREMLTDAGHVE